MQLTLKTLKGEKFTVNAEESSTIAEVKSIIEQEKSELPAATMKLIHSGKVLKDTQTIAECQMKPNAFLVVMISKAKKKVEKKPAAAAPAPATEAPKTPAATSKPAANATAATTTTEAMDTSTSTTPAPAVAATPAASAPSSSTPSAPIPSSNEVSAETLSSLTAMGFPEEEARACLRAAGGNADVAVEFLMNGIPDYAQQAAAASSGAAATPATGTSTGAGAAAAANSGEPLAQLRNHPQINQLRTLVQSNPSTLQAVLTQIGQQQPDLLQEINGNQELFLQIMNEPVSADSNAPAPAPSSAPTAGAGANALLGAGGLPAEMMAGLGDPTQMAQMIEQMTPEQLQSMAAMMGLTPEQLQMTMQAIGRMPPEELQNYMNMAMQAEGGMPGMGGAGGAGAGGQQVLRLSPEEMAAVDRLTSMGFDRSEAAQAYIACDKNEDLAANLLMDGGFGFGDDTGGGGNGDDMYD